MEFNISTFVLEVINFLILMWILKHFLYRPVLKALERRRASIAENQEEANTRMEEAKSLEARYQKRLKAWDSEKQKLRKELDEELQEIRSHEMAKIQTELAGEEKKKRVNLQQEQDQALRQYQSQALKQGARFASKLLQEVAGPEVDQQLFQLLIKQLSEMNEDTFQQLKKTCREADHQIDLICAYPLSEAQQKQIRDQLAQICDQPVQLHIKEDPDLLAGLRIRIGAWSLRLNLHDELNGFVELNSENRSL